MVSVTRRALIKMGDEEIASDRNGFLAVHADGKARTRLDRRATDIWAAALMPIIYIEVELDGKY